MHQQDPKPSAPIKRTPAHPPEGVEERALEQATPSARPRHEGRDFDRYAGESGGRMQGHEQHNDLDEYGGAHESVERDSGGGVAGGVFGKDFATGMTRPGSSGTVAGGDYGGGRPAQDRESDHG